MAEDKPKIDPQTDENVNDKQVDSQTIKKWGKQVMKQRFTIYPRILMQSMVHFELKPGEFLVLLQLVEHWWRWDENPFPSVKTLADRVGFKPRHTQDILKSLEKKGLIKRVPRKGLGTSNNQGSNSFDLSGLREKLTAFSKKVEAEEKRKNELAKLNVTPEYVKGLQKRAEKATKKGSD